jgi:uncharacterized protein (DUF2336 family)
MIGHDDNGLAHLTLRGLKAADYVKAEAKLTIEQKAALATHLAGTLDAESATAEDLANAEAVLRLIVWNGEPPVVEAMARAAARNPNTPRSVAWALANDDDAVATPILEASIALSDNDLVAIIELARSTSRMIAIARRAAVSETVSSSIARHGDEETVDVLLGNANAQIGEGAYGSMLDRFGTRERIQEAIAGRGILSPPIVERLLSVAGPNLAKKVTSRHRGAGAAPPTEPAGDRVIGYVYPRSEADWDKRIAQLIGEKSLTESFLVNQLCLGDYDFFCRALAALSGVPRHDVHARVLESPAAALPALWEKAALAADWLPVARATASALIHIDQSYSKADRRLFSRNVVDRTVATLKAEKTALTDAQRRLFSRIGSR